MTNIFWSVLSSKNGVDVNRLVMMVSSSDNIHPEVRTSPVLYKGVNICLLDVELSRLIVRSFCCADIDFYLMWIDLSKRE